jgi:peptidoglycan L-alanyl-D-glutamate endopeptidase CwlK
MILNAASEKKLANVKPALVRLVRRAAELTKQDFQIVQGNRTQKEQDALYAQGRTKPGKRVTWTRNSKHIGGNAIDFAALVNGKISWNEKLYPAIGKAFKQAAAELGQSMVWGGDWQNRDWGHIQISGAGTTSQPVAPTAVAESPTSKAPAGWYDPQRAVKFFEGRGWSRYAACALVGSLMWESAGNNQKPPTIIWDAKGDKDKHGVFKSLYAPQLNGPRIKAYDKFVEKNKRDHLEPYAQLAFMDHELRTTEKRAAKALVSATSLEEANKAAIMYWRPGTPHADKRLALVKKLHG